MAASDLLQLYPGSGSIYGLSIICSLVALLVATLFFRTNPIALTRSPASKKVLLIGPTKSGKTALFSKLLFGKSINTRTTVTESKGFVSVQWHIKTDFGFEPLSCPPILMVDLPGAPRLRARCLSQNMDSNTDFVMTIEAVSGLFAKTIEEAGDHLQILLSLCSLLPYSSRRARLLIVLTKTDLLSPSTQKATSTLIERAKLALAREMEKRRLSVKAIGRAAQKMEGLSSVNALPQKTAKLPSDETEILQTDIFDSDQSWSWDQVPLAVDWVTYNNLNADAVGPIYDWLQLD